MTSTIKVDTISENTSANGVAVDGVTLKDGAVGAAGTATSVAGIPFFQGDTGSIYTHDVSGTDSTAQYNTAYGLTAMMLLLQVTIILLLAMKLVEQLPQAI